MSNMSYNNNNIWHICQKSQDCDVAAISIWIIFLFVCILCVICISFHGIYSHSLFKTLKSQNLEFPELVLVSALLDMAVRFLSGWAFRPMEPSSDLRVQGWKLNNSSIKFIGWEFLHSNWLGFRTRCFLVSSYCNISVACVFNYICFKVNNDQHSWACQF